MNIRDDKLISPVSCIISLDEPIVCSFCLFLNPNLSFKAHITLLVKKLSRRLDR